MKKVGEIIHFRNSNVEVQVQSDMDVEIRWFYNSDKKLLPTNDDLIRLNPFEILNKTCCKK